MNKGKPVLLVFPFEQLSHYTRCLQLAQHLRGYFEVLFAHSARYAAFVKEAGFRTFPCLSLDAATVMECAKKFNFSWLQEKNLEPVFADQVRAIQAVQPVAVLGDNAPTLKMAAEKTGVTYISLFNGYMSKYYARVRKLSRTNPAYKLLKKLPEEILEFMTRQGEALAFREVHHAFRKLRRQYGLSRQHIYLDELEGDLNLICDLPELFPQKEVPRHYRIIAPLFYNTPNPKAAIANRLDPHRKTIFVSMGSTGDWEQVAFLNHPYFTRYNMVTAGDAECIIQGPTVIRAPFVNIHEFFSATDLVICHGGNGTIYQALLYGIPVLCKTVHFEQEWNADALEKAGLGQSLDGLEDLDSFIEVIDGWIEKEKGNALCRYQQAIRKETEGLDRAVRDIAGTLLYARLPGA